MTLVRASMLAAALAIASLLASTAGAQTVGLSGILGNRALLMINSGTPRSMAPGESYQGVKVVSVSGEQAVLEISGQRVTVKLGEAPGSVGGRGVPNGTRIVLTSDSRGHFISDGRINNQSMRFMVDTGATTMALSAADADRMNIDYKAGQPVNMSTANGNTQGWRIKLSSVRVGDVEIREVDAVIVPMAMPYVLLGNSFLTQFQMTRTNDQMVLERRF